VTVAPGNGGPAGAPFGDVTTEEGSWEALLDALGGLGAIPAAAEVRYSACGEAAVRVASRGDVAGPHAAAVGEGVEARCGDARAWLAVVGAPAELAERAAPLLAWATALHTALRTTRLRREHARLHAALVRHEAHALRQDLWSLSTLATAAMQGPLPEPASAYAEALEHCARHSERELEALALTAQAAADVEGERRAEPEGLVASAWQEHHGGRPRPQVTLPPGPVPVYRVAGPVGGRIVADVLAAAYGAAPDEAAPVVRVTPHPDGWETRVEVPSRPGAPPWDRVTGAELSHVALAVNLLGGRSWTGDGRDGTRSLAFTLPAAP
jgi:hypothetical protein